MEIVYISSDNSREEFYAEFEKMPWLAIDGDQEGTMLKHALATNLKAFSIPALVILNTSTGNFVTDLARKDILEIMKPDNEPQDFQTKGTALVENWKTMEPIAIGHNSTVLTNLQNAIDFFASNPLYLVLFMAFLMFSSIIQRIIENPLIGVAFWLIFKNFTKERLSRNEPYTIQEATKTADPKATTLDNKKNQ